MILFTMLPMEGLGYILRPFIKGSCCDGDRVQQEDCKEPSSQNDARQAGGGKALISFDQMDFYPFSFGQVEGQSKLVQNTKKKIINVNDNYVKSPPALSTYTEEEDESSSSQVLQSHQENAKILKKEGQGGNAEENEGESFDIEGLVEKLSLETALDPKKHSMAEVVFSMMKRGGEKLKKLQSTDIVGSGYQLDCCSLLGEVAAEHNLNLTYRLIKSLRITFSMAQ